MAKIIDSLVEYMLAARRTAPPAEVIQKGKSHLLDSLAAVVSGSTLKPGKLGLQHARQQGGREECSVLGSSLKTTPILAAFANGMSGHADETDDSNSQLHPGCAIVPAALAVAESQNRSGEALLRAVILGYELGFVFIRRLNHVQPASAPRSVAPRRQARWRNWMIYTCAILFPTRRSKLPVRALGWETTITSRKLSTTPRCRRATALRLRS